MSWSPINWRVLGDRAPVTPSIGGLVYPGRRHVFSGVPESAKTWAAFAIALDEIRSGRAVLHVDFEMYAYETRERLRAMGATDDDLELFLHLEPETPADDAVIGELIDEWNPSLVVIDAAAGAYALQGLDDNKRQDAELFTVTMIEPFRARGVATVVLDHVTKNHETRGGFAIGSERKVGGADVHLGFEPVVPFGRGRVGLVKVKTHKDRFGYLPRPTACELELRSDATTGAVTWEFRQPESEPAGEFRPTALMENVSRYLEQQDAPVSRGAVEQDVTGKRDFVRLALDTLVAELYVAETRGARGSRLYETRQPFVSSPLAPTSPRPRPGEVDSPRPTSPTPYKGGEGRGEVNGAAPPTTSPRPVIGDPGYPLLVDAAYSAGHITAAELRQQLHLGFLTSRTFLTPPASRERNARIQKRERR